MPGPVFSMTTVVRSMLSDTCSGDGAAVVGELHGVLNEVVHHLVEQVLVAQDHLGPGLFQAPYLNALFVNLLLEGEQRGDDGIS